MQALTGKQKRHLKSLAQSMPPLAVIGKGGLSQAALDNVRRLLDGRELLKVRLPALPPADRKSAAAALAESVGAACVDTIGRMVLLYRPCESLDPSERISLP